MFFFHVIISRVAEIHYIKQAFKRGVYFMKIINRVKAFAKKYSHAWVFLYTFIYMPWFSYLEKHIQKNYFIIHSPLDDFIPFNEYFIIPYYFWFVFMAICVFYFFFTDKKGFYKITSFLIIGMTMFLIICTVFPNGLNLRPAVFARDNFCVDMVRHLYRIDTPTNVLPSIHVFNTVGILIAAAHSEKLRFNKGIMCSVYITGVFIILSTVFLKQHSIFDVITAFIMAFTLYPLVYKIDYRAIFRTKCA